MVWICRKLNTSFCGCFSPTEMQPVMAVVLHPDELSPYCMLTQPETEQGPEYMCWINKQGLLFKIGWTNTWTKTRVASGCACHVIKGTLTHQMYLWWSLCAVHFLTCQMGVTTGDSGLCCCVYVMSFWALINPLGPRPAAALSLRNSMQREVTVSNDPGIQL